MKTRSFAIRAVAVSILAIAVWRPALADEQPVVRDAPAPKTMLFIGNSFVYYNNSLHNHVRKLTQSLDPEHAKAYFFKSMTISGSYLADHMLGAEGMIANYKHKRKKGPWELVVLQGQSREPINKKKMDEFRDAAQRLDAMVRAAGSRTVLFMTWAYKDKPAMAKPLQDAYTRMGNELKALVIPVGLAFDLARAADPGMELYASDKRHPSLLGSYLAAGVFYATLYGKSPVGATYAAGLSDGEAKFAQAMAWKAVRQYFRR